MAAYQYTVENTTRVLEIAPIDNLSVATPVMPDVIPLDNGVRLQFSEEVAASTISLLRSRAGYVDYTVRNIGSIPHDFVHATLSPIMQGRIIGGQTPDIVWDTEDGATAAIEIATRHVQTYEKARSAVHEKLNKYYHHIQEGRLQKINIVVVYMQGVITLGDVLTQESVNELVTAYHMGLSVLDRIRELTTLEVDPELESLQKEHLWFKGISYPEAPQDAGPFNLILSGGLSEELDRLSGEFHIPIDGPLLRKTTIGMISSWLMNLPGKKNVMDTIIHLPIIKMVRPDEMPILQPAQGYQPLIQLYLMSEPEDLNLRSWRDISLETRQEIRKIERRRNIKIYLSEEDRIHLAERGVLKKSIAHIPIVQQMDDAQSESYSGTCPTDDYDDFCHTAMEYKENDLVNLADISDLHINDQTGFDPHKFVTTLLNTDLFWSISLLDLIVREVILSMKDHPDDDRRASRFSFISKRIGPFNVVIRPTKYNDNSDTPIFFMIMSSAPFLPLHGIFEEVFCTAHLYHTKFVSLSRLRAEHYCNILPQCISLYAMLYDELGPGLNTSEVTLSKLNQVITPAKIVLSILLEDKEHTSRNLQQLRYYYMELLGTGPSFSEKIAEKLDQQCRSRILLHLMRNLTRESWRQQGDHVLKAKAEEQELKQQETSWSGSDSSEREEATDEDQQFLAGLKAREPHVDIWSVLEVKHTTLQTLLIPMYLSVLHNKNEQEKTLAAKQIMNKILKEEYLLLDSMFCRGDQSTRPDLKSYRHHDWSAQIVKKAAMMLRDELKELTHQDLHLHCMSTMYRTTLEDLATTKASHSGIVQSRLENADEIEKIGRRDKCFIQLLEHSPFPSARLVECVEYLRDRMVQENDQRVLVQMFKKNQIGGTREILILDFVSRCLIRTLEDMSRALCEAHPYECLTKPHSKGNMTATHSFKVKSAGFEGETLTWRASLDKTTWAQMFVNPIFYTLLSTLLPEYAPFIRFVLDCHTRKRMELPKDLVRSFYNSKVSHLSEYEVSKLREEFLGFTDPVVTDGPYMPYVNNRSNMMQGILHYTSSLLHTAYCVMLKMLFNNLVKKTGNTMVFSAQVSSDDSGIICTVFLRNKLSNITETARALDAGFQRCITTLDQAFAVRTSLHKSTMTFRPLYEFNSAFYSGNNYTCPLIKFVARACDDNPAESLRARVINLHNSLREVRSNGGSGALCSVISVAQKLTLFMNLGRHSMSFYPEYIKPLMENPLSHLGVMVSHPPLTAGLYGADFSDYYICMTRPDVHRLLSVLHRRPAVGGKLLSDLSAYYRAWPTQKYARVMERLNIEPGFGNTLSFEQLEFLFRPTMSWDDVESKVRLSVSNQSVARSFTFLTRCETIMSSAYLLWDKIFRTEGEALALEELVANAKAHASEDEPLSLDKIFPNHMDLSSVYVSVHSFVQIDVLRSRFIYRPHVYEPLHSGLHDMALIKQVLAKVWYGMVVKPSETTIRLTFASLQHMLPWLDADPKTTLQNSGMQSPLELINYITLLSERVKPVTLISMGGTRKNRSVIENVALLNTFRNRLVLLRQPEIPNYEPEVHEVVTAHQSLARRFQARVGDWHQLINQFLPMEGETWRDVDDLVLQMDMDMKELARIHEAQLRVLLSQSSARKTAANHLSLIDHGVWNQYVIRNPDRSLETHIGELKVQAGRQIGACTILKKIGPVVYRIKCRDSEVLEVSSSGAEIDIDYLMYCYPYLDFSKASRKTLDYIFFSVPDSVFLYRGQIWLCNNSGRTRHHLCQLDEILGNMLEPLPRSHLAKFPLANLWLSRSINIPVINRLLSINARLREDLTRIAIGAQRLISTAKVRSQFMRKAEEFLDREQVTEHVDMNDFFDELFAGYEFKTEEPESEQPDIYIPDEYINSEWVRMESDLFSQEFRSEPDIGFLALHPLMAELIRMINMRDMGSDGLGRVALEVSLQLGLITRDYYNRVLNTVDMDELLSML